MIDPNLTIRRGLQLAKKKLLKTSKKKLVKSIKNNKKILENY